MKKLLFLLVLTLVSLFSWSGCDLFGDDEYCQYESKESKIWSSGTDIGYSHTISSVSFAFNRNSTQAERYFHLKNVCPLGALVVRASLTEKEPSFYDQEPLAYRVLVIEVLPNSGYYRIRKVFNLYRQSENQLTGQTEFIMGDLPDSGPREFFVEVYASFTEGTFVDLIDLENWAQDNVSKVVYEVDYVKWK